MICPPLKQGDAEGRREGKSQRIVKCESGCRGGAGYTDGGSQAVQRFKSEKENFEFNTVSHRKPVKIMQNWGDMCRTLGVGELCSLKTSNLYHSSSISSETGFILYMCEVSERHFLSAHT